MKTIRKLLTSEEVLEILMRHVYQESDESKVVDILPGQARMMVIIENKTLAQVRVEIDLP